MRLRHLLVAALTTGALLRIVYFIWSQELPFFDYPITDALYHHRLAASIAQGQLWDGRPFFRAPLYPYLLGALYALFGVHIWIGKVFGFVLGLAGGGLTIALADRLFARRGALLAALLWLGSGLLLFFEGELLIDPLFSFLTICSIYLLLTADGRGSRFVLAAGIFGLAAIARPTILATAPLWIGWALWQERRHGLRIWLGAVLAAAAPILLVCGINSYATGRPVGIATQGGINFYIGNNLSASGYTAVLPEPWGYAWNYRSLSLHAARQAGRPIDEFEVSDFYYGLGRQFIATYPERALELAIKKVLLSVNALLISNNLNLPYVVERIPILAWLPVRIAWLFPLALAGLLVPLSGSSLAGRRFLWLFILLYSAVFALFFVAERFRLPLVPVWIILASGVTLLWNERLGRRVTAAAVVVLGLMITLPNWYGLVPENRALAHFNLGNVEMRKGNNAAAVAQYDTCLALDPDLHQPRLNRGLMYMRMGQRDQARRDFMEEAIRFRLDARPFNNLAALELLAGDTAKAEGAIDSGLARDSTLELLYLQRLAIAEAHADTATLRQTLEGARGFAGDRPIWTFWQGELDRLSGRGEEGRRAYRSYAAHARPTWPSIDGEEQRYGGPTRLDLDYRIGLTYVTEDRLDSAEYYFAKAALSDSGFAEAWSNWGTAALSRGEPETAVERYRVSLAAHPGSPVVWTNLAMALLAAGFPDSARMALGAALDLEPTFTPARIVLRQIDSLFVTPP